MQWDVTGEVIVLTLPSSDLRDSLESLLVSEFMTDIFVFDIY